MFSPDLPFNTMSSVWLVAGLVCPPSGGLPVVGAALICGAERWNDQSDRNLMIQLRF